MKILLSTVAVLFLIGCSSENKQEAKEVVEETKTEVVQNIKETQNKTSEKVEDITTKVAEKTDEVVSDVAEKTQELQEEVSQTVEDVTTKVVEKTDEVVSDVASSTQELKEEVSEKTDEVTSEIAATIETAEEDTKEAAATPQIDAAAIYKVCAGCHGADGSKVALGKSQVIKGWDAKKTEDALLGYKNKTYGGVMKGLMTSQVANLSEEEIKAVSEYIATF